MKTILFLCTGNYYRSRFAEELFNHHAQRIGLNWVAQSRGLALERGAHNVGPISPFALHALKELAITARGAHRFPQQCAAGDGRVIFKHACKLGCEGIVSKRLGSPYRSGRSDHWLKIKNPAAPAVRGSLSAPWPADDRIADLDTPYRLADDCQRGEGSDTLHWLADDCPRGEG